MVILMIVMNDGNIDDSNDEDEDEDDHDLINQTRSFLNSCYRIVNINQIDLINIKSIIKSISKLK